LSPEPYHKTGPLERLLPVLARFLIKCLTFTVFIRCEGIEFLDDMEKKDERAVLAFFHGRQFLLAGYLRGRKMGIMSSLSRDGELQTRVMAGLGYKVVRGSASRGGARGFIGLKRLMEKGYHATFAVDGPKGPLHEVKPGAVYLAKKTGAPVLGIAASAKPAHILSKTWDLYLLPWPFARGAVVFGPPIYFDGDTSDEAMRRDSLAVQDELLRLQTRADEITGLKDKIRDKRLVIRDK